MQSFLGLRRLNSNTQELPTEVKEEYLRRAILLMDRNPMVCVLKKNLSVLSSSMTFSIRMGPGPPAATSDLSSQSKMSSHHCAAAGLWTSYHCDAWFC